MPTLTPRHHHNPWRAYGPICWIASAVFALTIGLIFMQLEAVLPIRLVHMVKLPLVPSPVLIRSFEPDAEDPVVWGYQTHVVIDAQAADYVEA